VRCSFVDRTIATVIPQHGSVKTLANGAQLRDDTNSVVEVIDNTANRRSIRLSQVHPHHEFFPYVAHVMAFARFAELPETARLQLGVSRSADPADPAANYPAQLGLEDRDRDSMNAVQAALIRTQQLLAKHHPST
jgi:hypothetical protein